MMDIPENIIKRLKLNEETADKFYGIETRILSILNYKDFFEHLLADISQTFTIPHVWLSIINESSIFPHINAMEDSELVKKNTGFISHEAFSLLADGNLKPILANKSLGKFSSLFPKDFDYALGSIAIAPLTLDGEIIGSLNMGDLNAFRYQPGIDTRLLERLALKLSICLSNVTAHEKLKFYAYHDPLTGLLNRRVMEKILDREFERARRYEEDFSVIFMDLDRFKTINDKYGHDQGDAALIHVAKALIEKKRQSDTAARFAGDEFVLLLPSTDKMKAESFILRVKNHLDTTPLKTDSDDIVIGLSFGIASAMENDISDSAKLLKLADERLYQAKRNRQ